MQVILLNLQTKFQMKIRQSIISFFDRLKRDYNYRIKTFLFCSFIFTIIYSVFLFVISQINSSKWFLVMSIYYILLSASRIFILVQMDPKKNLRSKITTMHVCGVFLLIINVVVSIMMFILIFTNLTVKHHEITVITLATYTFTSLSFAIIGTLRHLKLNNYVYFCAKIISLISSSVSLTTLTNTMLSTFGEDNLLLRNIILPILCGAVSIFIILCAILMIRKANAKLRILKNEK